MDDHFNCLKCPKPVLFACNFYPVKETHDNKTHSCQKIPLLLVGLPFFCHV